MKLRIRCDSLRLRLKRGEVAQVAAGKSIVEETHFPGSVLTYAWTYPKPTTSRRILPMEIWRLVCLRPKYPAGQRPMRCH